MQNSGMNMGLDDNIYLNIVIIKSQPSGFALTGQRPLILVQRSDTFINSKHTVFQPALKSKTFLLPNMFLRRWNGGF